MHRGQVLLSLVSVAGYLTAAGAGCTTECRGPGCEASYAGGRLAILEVAARATDPIDAWADATGLYEGNDDDGTGFVASVAAGTILLGQPDAGRVIPLATVSGVAAIPTDPPAFVGLGIRFGAAVLAQPTGEGFDLWVGAPDDRLSRGAVYVFRDAHLGARLVEQADVQLTSAAPPDAPVGRFGTRLFRCADLDGDAIDDVAVNTPWFADGGVPALAGAVTVILSSDLIGAVPIGETAIVSANTVGRTWWGAEEGESAGDAVLCDRDVNADGAVDLVVGAPYAGSVESGDAASGRVYVVPTGDRLPAGGTSLDQVADTTIDGPTEEWFGTSLAAWEVDGEPVLAVGAAGYADGEGRVWLLQDAAISAAAITLTVSPDLAAELPELNAVHLGRFTGSADVDGDGADDLVVGAPDFGTGTIDVDMGRAWVFLAASQSSWAPADPTTSDADVEIVGTEPFQRVGQDVTLADLDADGDDEILLPTRAKHP